MPQLPGVENLQKFYLPSTQKLNDKGEPTAPEADWAWVVMDVSPSRAADTEHMDTDITRGRYGLLMVAARIKEWNYEQDNGDKVPITAENVGRLNTEDYGYLVEQIPTGDGGLTVEEKKVLSPILPPSETEKIQG